MISADLKTCADAVRQAQEYILGLEKYVNSFPVDFRLIPPQYRQIYKKICEELQAMARRYHNLNGECNDYVLNL